MPIPVVAKMAKEVGISVEKAEDVWDKAKKAAEDQDRGDDWAYVTGIFKKMIGSEKKMESEKKSFKEHVEVLIEAILTGVEPRVLLEQIMHKKVSENPDFWELPSKLAFAQFIDRDKLSG